MNGTNPFVDVSPIDTLDLTALLGDQPQDALDTADALLDVVADVASNLGDDVPTSRLGPGLHTVTRIAQALVVYGRRGGV